MAELDQEEAEILEAFEAEKLRRSEDADELLTRHIEVARAVRGGKPCLTGTRITVDDVVLMHNRLGQTLEEIAGKYDLALAAVYAAMAYYYDHRDEVDRRIEKDQAFVEAFRRANPAPLQEKLRALGCE